MSCRRASAPCPGWRAPRRRGWSCRTCRSRMCRIPRCRAGSRDRRTGPGSRRRQPRPRSPPPHARARRERRPPDRRRTGEGVGVAHAGIGDPDQHLALLRRGDVDLDDFERPAGREAAAARDLIGFLSLVRPHSAASGPGPPDCSGTGRCVLARRPAPAAGLSARRPPAAPAGGRTPPRQSARAARRSACAPRHAAPQAPPSRPRPAGRRPRPAP